MAEPASVPQRSVDSTGLSYLFLLTIAVQGFHVAEHILVVIQVSVWGMGLDEAHGLLGARVDFEWLHFAYNLTFLGALLLLVAYAQRRRRTLAAATGPLYLAVAGAAALQTYHVAEHTLRIVQYLQTGCIPCEGAIGQVVPFIWPHLFFGLFAYVPLVLAYFAYGLHRQLGVVRRLAAPQPAAARSSSPRSSEGW